MALRVIRRSQWRKRVDSPCCSQRPIADATVGFEFGSTLVPGGLCQGVELDIEGAQLAKVFPVDANGEKSVALQATEALCGALLQSVDLGSCGVGNLVVLPN